MTQLARHHVPNPELVSLYNIVNPYLQIIKQFFGYCEEVLLLATSAAQALNKPAQQQKFALIKLPIVPMGNKKSTTGCNNLLSKCAHGDVSFLKIINYRNSFIF